MISTGLDRLLRDPAELAGRRYGLLTHLAAVSADLVPCHLALGRSRHPPARLFGPEHGLFAVAQDMESTEDGVDPWTGLPVVSLYGEEADSLRPEPSSFDDLDLLLIDLQDVGSRYYTYAATAVWSARAAATAGCEVWLLDRPNPLGGERLEGNLRAEGYESFVGAFEHPVVHGLTLGEICRLELAAEEAAERLRVVELEGWSRQVRWEDLGRAWIAPSPNMPTYGTARIYPGLCLVEATELSEGRGTTRPFQLVGAPGVDAPALVERLARRELPGVAFAPAVFRPEFQKHAGLECSGVEIVVTESERLEPYRLGVELLLELAKLDEFSWREQPYEFVSDRPAIDLLTGSSELREAIETGREPGDWIESWRRDEAAFRERVAEFLIY